MFSCTDILTVVIMLNVDLPLFQIFTAAPPLAMGLFDRYCNSDTRLQFPELYKSSQNAQQFNVKVR